MLSFDFRHVTELHGLPNDGWQVSRSGQKKVASQQTDGPQTKLGYDKTVKVSNNKRNFTSNQNQMETTSSAQLQVQGLV